MRCGSAVSLRDWALEICDSMALYADFLDGEDEDKLYSAALAEQREMVLNPELTPSARMLAEMREHRESFFEFAQRNSEMHQHYFLEQPIAQKRRAMLQQEAESSLARQKQIEEADNVDFDSYLQAYFSQ